MGGRISGCACNRRLVANELPAMTAHLSPIPPLRGLTDISVRPAQIADAAYFPSIERSAGTLFETVPELAWLAAAPDRSVPQYRALISEGLSWTAVTPEGHRAGFLSSALAESEIHIWELAVSRPYQRKGIGGALLGEAVAEARNRGLAAITLTTFGDLPWNAPFYARNSFTILPDEEITARLRAVLDQESAQGLPLDRRRAMRLCLPASSGTGTGG